MESTLVNQGPMAWGSHGLLKVSLPLYTLQASTLETALWSFQGWPPTGRAAYGCPTTPLNTVCLCTGQRIESNGDFTSQLYSQADVQKNWGFGVGYV
jgi:hypothetical protein